MRGGEQAPGTARHLVTGILDGEISHNTRETLALLVSEVVTNSVVHGNSDDTTEINVKCELKEGTVHFRCWDTGDGFAAETAPSDPSLPGGWGLVLVDQLAKKWGVENPAPPDQRWSLWFEIPAA